ncbi:DNA cytosine methyltransferase, partial [Bisgaard Taxon 45]
MKKWTVIDLFSGAGGLSRGFYDAGYSVVIGVDFDDFALKTFEYNHGDAKALKLDLFNLENINVLKNEFAKYDTKLDVLVGGPPCQGFSLAGKREKNDDRNKLYTAMVEAAKQLKPRVVVLENVPGLLTLYNGQAKEKIFADFENLGYKMNVKVLYAPDYGIPQIRKRAFFVGLLDSELQFEFPSASISPSQYITCEEAISDLPALEGVYGDDIQDYEHPPLSDYQREMRANSLKIYNHIGSIHSEKTVKMISLVPEGKNYKALPSEYQGIYKYN